MDNYDDIVVGSGISGLTLALLLGLNGHSVLLLEKSKHIGGALARFRRKGIPFDTGFHFTGGAIKNGILHDMLLVLGLVDSIHPIYLFSKRHNCLIFEREQKAYELPVGVEELMAALKGYFPSESSAIERYFQMAERVCDRTASMDLRNLFAVPQLLEEDFISLERVLSELTDNAILKGLLSKYAMCYGTKPSEMSFANHCRISYGLYQSLARVKDGGDAFIRAFLEGFKGLNVAIRCNSHILECADIHDKKVGRFILSTGEEVSAKNCVFSIHPKEIVKTLPKEILPLTFTRRVSEFESSAGFFSAFGVVESDPPCSDFEPAIVSLFSTPDVNQLMDPSYSGDPALVIMKSQEGGDGERQHQVLNAFEVSFPERVSGWKDSTTDSRPRDYYAYKEERVRSIRERVLWAFPEYKSSFRIVDSASILTFRDYLNSPDGSAYGIKQKIGQHNVFGRLPLRNLYATGQSAMLPGIMGAMMSSFIVGRNLIGRDQYMGFLKRRLCG